VPTLTEVVELGVGEPAMSAPNGGGAASRLESQGGAQEAALVERVLVLLQPRIEHLLEVGLLAALAPALARAAEGLVRETRPELAAALRELVQQAVRQAGRERTPD
jgi:hypothetical protein